MYILTETSFEKCYNDTDQTIETKTNIVCSNDLESLGSEIWWRYPRIQTDEYLNLVCRYYTSSVSKGGGTYVDLDIEEIPFVGEM